MFKAFIWGLIATSSLAIGGLLGASVAISKKWLGVIMAFGAGVLLSAVAYELVFESIKLAAGSGFPAFGFFAGALVFFGSDELIGSLGVAKRKSINASHGSNLVVPMILALWFSIALLCAVFTAVGYVGFEHVPDSWLGFVQAFAGGAILMMLANTMIPEAYEHGRKLAGVFTVLGFAVSVGVILVERMDQVHRVLSK